MLANYHLHLHRFFFFWHTAVLDTKKQHSLGAFLAINIPLLDSLVSF